MNLPVVIILVGLSYIVLIGVLSLLRREGLSLRFAVESIIVTVVVSGLAAVIDLDINPVLFLIVLYLITTRVRLLVDLANIFAKQGRYSQASSLYNFTSGLYPDATGKLILMVNQATLFLQEGKLDDAIAMFNDVLNQAGQGYLGVKYEAAAHFNLGVAHLRKGSTSRAMVEFNSVIDTWPTSLYARRAQEALARCRSKEKQPADGE